MYLVATPLSVAQAANTIGTAGEARSYIQGLGDTIVGLLNKDGIDAKAREQKLIDLFKQHVDAPWMGRFVLGRYWRTASEGQKQRYNSYYQTFLINSYIPHFRKYTNENFTITGVRDEGKGEYTVSLNILSEKYQTIHAAYRVHKNDAGDFRIIDIIIEGVSLLSTQRSEFASVVSRQSLDSLIDQIQKRNERFVEKGNS